MVKKVDCYICGKENLTRNEIGLNKKLISQDIKKNHCLLCLAEYLEVTEEELLAKVKEFKEQGCKFF